jgi:hypothetical protein
MYEIESDDPAGVVARMTAALAAGEFEMTDALDSEHTAVLWLAHSVHHAG